MRAARALNALVTLFAAQLACAAAEPGEGRPATLRIKALPTYNIVHHRSPGVPFHPRRDGSGYVSTFADKRVHVAGETENVPEMKALQGVDVAFLPMNLPYTMTPEMVAEAAEAFRPRILYPYHTGTRTRPSSWSSSLGRRASRSASGR